MPAPLDYLRVDPGLAFNFFMDFARFEHAMKVTQFCEADRFGNAKPDWEKLKEELGADLLQNDEDGVQNALRYLLDHPPNVQKLAEDGPVFREERFRDECQGAQAIEAARRVRNNLFHGGKHVPAEEDRDQRLVEAALAILRACLVAKPELQAAFY